MIVFGRYTYEIVGGILIVLSSLVGEQMRPNWKRRSYLIFALVALAYIGMGIHLDRNSSTEQGKMEQKIADLTTSVSSGEKSRQSDRDAFIKQFDSLSRQISDIRSNVHNQKLQKQLEDTQHSLLQAQQAFRTGTGTPAYGNLKDRCLALSKDLFFFVRARSNELNDEDVYPKPISEERRNEWRRSNDAGFKLLFPSVVSCRDDLAKLNFKDEELDNTVNEYQNNQSLPIPFKWIQLGDVERISQRIFFLSMKISQ